MDPTSSYAIYRCPLDGGTLRAHEAERTLTCTVCGRSYALRTNVPDFVVDHHQQEGTEESFGFEWQASALGGGIENPDLLFGAPRDEVIDGMLASLRMKREDLAGKEILDAGCGDGNLSSRLAELGARMHAVDIHRYLEHVAERHAGRANLAFARASIFSLPFADETFDIVCSYGVIHHTPDPAKAFGQLSKLVKKGGQLSVYVYYSEDSRTNPFRVAKKVYDFLGMRKLSHRWLLRLCYVLSVPTYILHSLYRFAYPLVAGKRKEWAEHGRGRRMPLKSMVMKWFDALSPEYASTHPRAEVARWFESNGFGDVFSPEGVGDFLVTGRKAT
jgi:SAM-dependent methyltransferase